jgi:dipeptidyl aminopeptidase/acylaminoacyl peptidase
MSSATVTRPGSPMEGGMAMSNLRRLSLTLAIPLTLAITAGLPGQGVFHGTAIGLAQHASSADEGTRVRLKHNGRIAFVLNNPTGASIETINPDGSHIESVTQVCGYYVCGDDAYAWSPDGRRMALWREHNLTPPCSRRSCASTPATLALSLVAINANGTGEKQLARRTVRCAGRACYGAFVSTLSWSPNGKQVVFSQLASPCMPGRPSCEASLYVTNVSTGRVRRLTRCLSQACDDAMPIWSPVGARIAFKRNGSLFVVNANGSGLRRVPHLVAPFRPTWSPNGSSIALQSQGQICTIHPDGSVLKRLTRFAGAPGDGAGNPVWSPDGRRIAFFRDLGHRGGATGELWVMSSNGSHVRRPYIQNTYFGPSTGPAWSPDGKYIVFIRHSGISIIDANGGHLHVLVSLGEAPAWQPVP